jgi:hypothetical protein
LIHRHVGDARLRPSTASTFRLLLCRPKEYCSHSWQALLPRTTHESALILGGIAVPVGPPGAAFAKFVGYILGSLWLIAFAAVLWRRLVADAPRGRRPVGVDIAADSRLAETP